MNVVYVQVNGVVWDLDRPLEEDCKLSVLKFDDDEGMWSPYVAAHSLVKIVQITACLWYSMG